MFDAVSWPPGQRRLDRKQLGLDKLHRPIVALIDAVPVCPQSAHLRWRGHTSASATRANEVRLIITVGIEIYYTQRCPSPDAAFRFADLYADECIDRLEEQLPLLEAV